VRRPVVGVTGYIVTPEQSRVLGFGPRLLNVAPGTYLDWLRAEGMLPVPVPAHPESLHDEYLDLFDGLALAGGADIEPSRYGATPHPMDTLEPHRDAFEFALAAAALRRGLPILGICRGMQILNVALGGTMRQHLPDATGALVHSSEFRDGERHPADKWITAYHEVEVTDPELRELAGERLTTNSFHHQGVSRLGTGLRVAARATDGLVEAVVGTRHPVLGVQWHPEMHDRHDRAGTAPFRWLARRAAADLPVSEALAAR
jgi:putative glutamine amidotransferase